jgi:hypothetical protein
VNMVSAAVLVRVIITVIVTVPFPHQYGPDIEGPLLTVLLGKLRPRQARRLSFLCQSSMQHFLPRTVLDTGTLWMYM